MHLTALLITLAACAGIIAVGARFLLAPRQAMLGSGAAPDSLRALTEVKGIRHITSGVVLVVVWAAAGTTALGWALIAAALTPTADAVIVRANGGWGSRDMTAGGVGPRGHRSRVSMTWSMRSAREPGRTSGPTR